MEKDIEKMLTEGVKKMGGRCLKWVSPGNDGVPDRIVIMPGGRIWFVELKDDGGQLSELQKYWRKVLSDLGCRAVAVRGQDMARFFLQELRAMSREVRDEV